MSPSDCYQKISLVGRLVVDDKAGSFLHRYEATFVFVSVLCLVLLLWPVSGTKGFVLCIFYYYYLFILIFDC